MPTLQVRKLRPEKLKDTDITKLLLCARIYGRAQGFSTFRQGGQVPVREQEKEDTCKVLSVFSDEEQNTEGKVV